jgi:hypothetical protein
MNTIKTDIIPYKPSYAKINAPEVLNYEAICVFVAIGFFIDQDCYYKNEVCLRPATINTIDEKGFLIKSEPWFKWHYTPRDINPENALKEFTELFELIIDEQTNSKKVILPLSGGLDSRSQAVALKHLGKEVSSYSYSFKNGYNESKISEDIAEQCNFEFEKFEISKGYLWKSIKSLAKINKCYSEFTHPRQMGVVDQLKLKGELFSLGHWGDLLFDSTTDRQLSEEEELNLILKKIIKKGGLSLASKLWDTWSLKGNFEDYLRERVKVLLGEIKIDNSSAKIRAFKSLYWAPRWTSINLSIFETVAPISLPYYDNRMCEFICTIPESILANRQLQIDYIKNRNKAVSKIMWQEHKPFNLSNYKYNKTPYNLPSRALNKLKRIFKSSIGKQYVQRNWELQFIGNRNDSELKNYLFNNGLDSLIPNSIIKETYSKFKDEDQLEFSHPLSMLLTLSLWQSSFNEE